MTPSCRHVWRIQGVTRKLREGIILMVLVSLCGWYSDEPLHETSAFLRVEAWCHATYNDVFVRSTGEGTIKSEERPTSE